MTPPFNNDLVRKMNSSKGFRMFQDIPNPLPAEITDPEEIRQTFFNYPFIPYAQTDHASNYGLLIWLNSMRTLSPTHGACITSLHSYALGLPYSVHKVLSRDLNLTEEITDTAKEQFSQWLDDILALDFGLTLRQIGSQSFYNLKDNGNSFVQVTLSKEFGVHAMNIEPFPTEQVCYVRPDVTKANRVRYVGISHRWDSTYIAQHPPKIVPVFPAYTEDENTITTMVHIKNPTKNLYGRPDWINAFMSVYREFQDGNYLIKQTANNFMGQALIEFEEAQVNESSILDDREAQEQGFENAAHRFEQNFMAKSDDPQTVLLTTRPFGAKPAFVYQFKPNTSENFYKVMSELEELDIIRAHQWSKRFLGENQTQGFSKDVFIDELKVKEVAVLPYLREQALEPINIAISLAVQFFNKQEFKNIVIKGTSNVDILMQMLPEELLRNNEAITTAQKHELTDNE